MATQRNEKTFMLLQVGDVASVYERNKEYSARIPTLGHVQARN